jgi:predicted amidohydrolase
MICFDWIFPEAARTLALRGAEVIAHPVNLVLPYCQEAMKTRCIENRVYAVTANRIGREQRGVDDFTFTGASQITSTRGKVLSSGPVDSEHRDIVEIDVSEAREKSINPFNHLLSDRRPEFYD